MTRSLPKDTPLPTIAIGAVEFYNATALGVGDVVRCYISYGDIIQNGSAPIMLSREAWDALAAATSKVAS